MYSGHLAGLDSSIIYTILDYTEKINPYLVILKLAGKKQQGQKRFGVGVEIP